jgi:TIGR03009 family protein
VRRLASLLFLSLVFVVAMIGVVERVHAQAPGAAPPPPPSRVATVPPQPQVPAPLSPQEQAALDQLLAAWEARSAAVQTWSCTFHKWEYDNAWGGQVNGQAVAATEKTGEIKYAAPDKGLFRVKESKQWNQKTGQYETAVNEPGDHWVCNGQSIFEFRHAERKLVENRLPKEMQGKAITDGPLPFVFGAKAETLKKRYWMRIITPPQVTDQIWLEALPRFQADAANYSKVELILQTRDLMPFAIQIYKPGNLAREVYQFDQQNNLINAAMNIFQNFAKPMTPFGYKYVLEDPEAAAGPPAAAPAR